MIKPSQPPNQPNREQPSSTLVRSQLNQSQINHTIANTNNNHSSNTNNVHNMNGQLNGRVSNVSFASYDKAKSIEELADDHQQLLADKATSLNPGAVSNTNFQPSASHYKSQSNLEQTLTLLRSPDRVASNNGLCHNKEVNLGLLNGMFSSMGSHGQRRINTDKTESVRNGQTEHVLNGHSVIDDGLVGASSNHNGTERVNDIYVNRNIGALYGPSIHEAKDIQPRLAAPNAITLYEDLFSGAGYKGFYLHGSRMPPERDETRVYNAFSRTTRPEASAAKISNGPKLREAPIFKNESKHDPVDFEDDELTNILGFDCFQFNFEFL